MCISLFLSIKNYVTLSANVFPHIIVSLSHMFHLLLPRFVLIRTLNTFVGVELTPSPAVSVIDIPGLDLKTTVRTRHWIGFIDADIFMISNVVFILSEI